MNWPEPLVYRFASPLLRFTYESLPESFGSNFTSFGWPASLNTQDPSGLLPASDFELDRLLRYSYPIRGQSAMDYIIVPRVVKVREPLIPPYRIERPKFHRPDL